MLKGRALGAYPFSETIKQRPASETGWSTRHLFCRALTQREISSELPSCEYRAGYIVAALRCAHSRYIAVVLLLAA